jgi:predicted nucleic acid-binding protein
MITLVDSSSWVQFIRPNGAKEAKSRVAALLDAGNAAWCQIVRLELWNGAGDSHEKKLLRQLEEGLPVLPISETVWEEAVGLAVVTRSRGMTIPATDLLIFACARIHGVGIEFDDKHFELLEKLDRLNP